MKKLLIILLLAFVASASSAGLDTVFDSLAGVVSGDDLLPIQ